MIKLSQTYIKKCKTKFNNETLKEAVKEWRKDLKTNKNKYDHISELDTSEVTDMHGLFQNYIGINQDISKWNVSNLETMNYMFEDAISFNQYIGSWDVSNVKRMDDMFAVVKWGENCFNQDLSTWDVNKVTNMSGMFCNANNFNQDISMWNVSNVIDCKSFDQDAHNWIFGKPNFVNCNVKI